MANFTATLECDMFTYEVKAWIDEDGANPLDVYFGDKKLSSYHLKHFITVYGYADLVDEIMSQYDAWCKDQAEDNAILAFETERGLA